MVFLLSFHFDTGHLSKADLSIDLKVFCLHELDNNAKMSLNEVGGIKSYFFCQDTGD